ncbi:hypothetical protein GALMADRAFT_155997 [Galerina marginata CBS 339.88]|uniref:BTB domain-containing protein n=1 Tax=Galerina marginata (strain CBS 339.88) TaxID=685588 RepID=A0A067SZX4_GALM3|nr:hypothetical protein GALMADRAFT_155997 [Galerina marginata CBS 339.88]
MTINMAQPALEAPKAWLELVQQNSILMWREDVKTLFLDAKHHYPDIVWETQAQDYLENTAEVKNEVWGHRAIIYPKASPKFTALYLQIPAETSPSSNCLRFKIPRNHDHGDLVRDLRYFYTTQSPYEPGNAGTATSVDLAHLKPLSTRSLLSMWRDQQFSDVRITLPDETDYINCHCFMLSVRSSYFKDIMADEIGKTMPDPDNPLEITLPSPLFTPESVHLIIQYIYTGTLDQMKDSLSTAFAIFRGAVYLAIPPLQELVVAEIAVNILHGLHDAQLSDAAFMELVGGNWNQMRSQGCLCPQCAHYAPRVLQFSLNEGTKNDTLERGARRALVGLFGERWFTRDISDLPTAVAKLILASVQKVITQQNVLPLLFAAEYALLKHAGSSINWQSLSSVRAMIISVRKSAEQVLCASPRACFGADVWGTIVEQDDGDGQFLLGHEVEMRVGWAVQALLNGSNPDNWFDNYQILMDLANPQTESIRHALSSPNNRIKTQLESAKSELFELFSKVSLSLQESDSEYSLLLPTQRTMQTDVNYSTTITERQSPASSLYYSAVSVQESIAERPADVWDSIDNLHVSALGPANAVSLYSYASSRTISTEYGPLYTRRAFSQESIEDQDAAHRSIITMPSYESFWAQALSNGNVARE